MKRVHEFSNLAIAMVFFANAAVSQQARTLFERLTNGKGTYAADTQVGAMAPKAQEKI